MQRAETSRRRAAVLVVCATGALLLGGSLTAEAQIGGQFPPLGGSTTTTAAPGPTTTTTAPPGLLAPSAPAPSPTTAPPGGPAGEGDGAPPPRSGAMPADLRAMVDSVVRTPANNTRGLLAALAPLGQYGLDETQRAMAGFGRFPVAGEATWSDDWWFPRFGPGWRLHKGVDIFAAYGTPVRAPVDGVVRVTNHGLGGLAVYVRQPNQTYFYMAHLSGIAAGMADGVTVKTGQVVGYVGDSGNAKGGKAHLHFEVHPNGGPAVPPKPVIDRFVSDALGLVPGLLDAYAKAYAGRVPAAVPAEGTPSAPLPEVSTLSPRAALLWAAAANPAGTTLRLVEADARAAAAGIDWSAAAAASRQQAAAEQSVNRWLSPLVPRALSDALGW